MFDLSMDWGMFRTWVPLGSALSVGLIFFGRGRFVSAIPAALLPKRDPSPANSVPEEILDDDVATSVDPNDGPAMVRQMVALGRYSLLLRPQIADSLTDQQWTSAQEALLAAMTPVPEGEVLLAPGDGAPVADLRSPVGPSCPGRLVQVAALMLDRHAVTNRQFRQFVVAGGYRQTAWWDEAIWPSVVQFVDRTGAAGPKYWSNGRYASGEESLPVVGVSWYEVAAYARWAGKRLPTDAEWVKAAAWPVPLGPDTRVQRRYPWGDSMDRRRANLWSSGRGGPVAVDQFAEGTSAGGCCQLCGNVWEWLKSDFRAEEQLAGDVVTPGPMKSLRGGAFDTYCESQATNQFASGDTPLARKRNIGFRCALGVCDLVLSRNSPSSTGEDGQPVSAGGAP